MKQPLPMARSTIKNARPLSPNIQIYRPQLTSVLSMVHRIAGIVLSTSAVILVVWLVSAAIGAQAYATVQNLLLSGPGKVMFFVATFAFFLHFCGGIRHLLWDAGYGFELRTIYRSGWTVVIASAALTLAAWIISAALSGQGQ